MSRIVELPAKRDTDAFCNIIIKKLANDENCHYVDNESSFRLLNGFINTTLYNKDDIHLNYHGTRKLTHNLEIVSITVFNL
jgi:hypothetical protein